MNSYINYAPKGDSGNGGIIPPIITPDVIEYPMLAPESIYRDKIVSIRETALGFNRLLVEKGAGTLNLGPIVEVLTLTADALTGEGLAYDAYTSLSNLAMNITFTNLGNARLPGGKVRHTRGFEPEQLCTFEATIAGFKALGVLEVPEETSDTNYSRPDVNDKIQRAQASKDQILNNFTQPESGFKEEVSVNLRGYYLEEIVNDEILVDVGTKESQIYQFKKRIDLVLTRINYTHGGTQGNQLVIHLASDALEALEEFIILVNAASAVYNFQPETSGGQTPVFPRDFNPDSIF